MVKINGDGEPLSVNFDGRWLKVKSVWEIWRIKGKWWEREKEREYFQIEMEGNILCEIFKDMESGRWFIERIYD